MSELIKAAIVADPGAGKNQAVEDDAMLFSMETTAPLVVLPRVGDFRDVLKVIDARERSLQNIKTFLASMMFIRGNARVLPLSVLRRGRAKLARLLARYRVHSTNVIELINLWRGRYGAVPLESLQVDENPPPTATASNASRPRTVQGQPVQGLVAGKSPSFVMCDVVATAAVNGGAPPKPRTKKVRRPVAVEPFMWMGTNYVLKMRSDLHFTPLPTVTDPLLLNWFHYDAPLSDRRMSLRSPPDGGADQVWAEQEWWFDAERLHPTSDLARMRAAHEAMMNEALYHGLEIESPPDTTVVERAGNDAGREMEVLLYGGAGGFRAKLERDTQASSAAIRIQCLYGSFALLRRIKRCARPDMHAGAGAGARRVASRVARQAPRWAPLRPPSPPLHPPAPSEHGVATRRG